jgi:hypothetical protein
VSHEEPVEKVPVVCAWCGSRDERPASQGEPALPGIARPISHVICDACFKRERAEVERIVRGKRRRNTG